MPITETVTLYKFSELSDKAKERVRTYWREHYLDYDWWDFIYDDFEHICDILGIEIGTTHFGDRAIYFELYRQGAGACFEGKYHHKADAVQTIKKYAPQDGTLHRIAEALAEVQNESGIDLVAELARGGNLYYHEHSIHIQVYRRDDQYAEVSEEVEASLQEELRNLMRWLYRTLVADYEHLSSDEALDESIEINSGYDFLVNGDRLS